ncbi:NADP-dependent oxidoreductase domain-containing protein [Pisolithus croceorrhizus]|nr:NADP-dependent oxidoreductase domain-containing protein [Pisolithus croceorrhizus]
MASFIRLNDGNQLPWIAFGTGSALYGHDATESVRRALDNGFTHIDTAQRYGNEESVGRAIKLSGKSREELYVTTKLGKLEPGETVRDALLTSLTKLNLEYVDSYLVHNPSHHQGRLRQVWKEMEEVRKEGLARSIGVSNFYVEHLEEVLAVATITPAVNQIELHAYVWKSVKPTIAFDKEHDIVTSSYGGLSPIVRFPGGPVDAAINQIRARLEETRGAPVSDGQVLIKWLKQNGVLVVTTSSKAERIREYLDTINVPDLTEEEMKLIEAKGAELHRKAFVSRSCVYL